MENSLMTTTNTINIEVIVSQLQAMTLKQVQSVYPDYYTALEEHILSLADIAKDNESQWQLFALARSVKHQKAQLGKRMDQSILDAFLKFRMGSLGKEPKESDLSTSLSLIQDEDLERSIAVSSFARRAEARYMEILYTLNQRMAFLAGGKKLADDGNPLGPAQLAQSLTFMLEPLSLDNQLLAFSSRLFESVSAKALKELYETANILLIEQGLLPNLKYSITQKPSAAKPEKSNALPAEPTAISQLNSAGNVPQSGQVASSAVQPTQAMQSTQTDQAVQPAMNSVQQAAQLHASQITQTAQLGGAEYQQFLLDNINQIQQQVRDVSSVGANQPSQASINTQNSGGIPDIDSAFGQTVNHEAAMANVLQAVDGLQSISQVLQQFDAQSMPSVTVAECRGVSQLVSAKAESENAGVDSLNTIDLVGKIFEYMLSDEQLPDAVKAVLSYLHTPFLKIALTDEDFLGNAEHPAKRLLDCLAESGRRWVNNDGQSQLRIFPKIKETVRRLMIEFSENPAVIVDLCSDMEDFNQKMAIKVAMLEERARSKSEGEEQLRLIKRKAYFDIKQIVGAADLPAPVLVLVFHPLADYITLMGLRFGIDSEEWIKELALVTYLVNSVNVEAAKVDLAFYISNNAGNRDKVSVILKEIAFDNNRSIRLLSLLERAQRCAIDALPFSIESTDKDLVVDKQKFSSFENDKTATDKEREVIEQLVALEYGTWLEFSSEQFIGHARVKIAWYNSHSHRFMLSDNSGQFRVMRSAVDLAAEKIAGRVSIVEKIEKPFFERALENVLMKLRHSSAVEA